MNQTVTFPLIGAGIAALFLLVLTIFRKFDLLSKFGFGKPLENKSVHDFINIRDIKGNFLYTNDDKICAFFKIDPISVDLYSQREKRQLCQLLSSQLASENKPFKFLAVSRPVDISPLISEYKQIIDTSPDTKIKDILKNEMIEMNNYAHSGDVVQRQFYFMIWEDYKRNNEQDLLKRITEFASKFKTCRLSGEVLKQHEIVRLCNLVNNPAYTHIEDMSMEANIPTIIGLYGNRNEEGDADYA